MEIKSVFLNFLNLLPLSPFQPSYATSPSLIASLPEHLVPTHENNRRLIIIGDIHGMHTSLMRLLSEVSFSADRDHIIAAGDMVNKGPDSAAVVSTLMSLNASAVRGNHEDHVLLRDGNKAARRTAKQLSHKHLQWLANLPVILTIDQLAMFVVHAGMVPGVRPEKQDPWAVMNMRTLVYPNQELKRSTDSQTPDQNLDESQYLDEEETNIFEVPVPTDGREGKKWSSAWDKRQDRQRKHTRRTIVYGHDAKRGLVLGDYTFGLDSGCVNGGELTAMVVKATKKGDWKHKIHQVSCRKDKKEAKEKKKEKKKEKEKGNKKN